MSSLDRLRSQLRRSSAFSDDEPTSCPIIEKVIADLTRHLKSAGSDRPVRDRVQEALEEFWDNPRFETPNQARLVSYGLALPVKRNGGPCVLEDRKRFEAVLSRATGVDQWMGTPRIYRKCYRGLLRSYFAYPKDQESRPRDGRANWAVLRDYLKRNVGHLTEGEVNPEWTEAVGSHADVLGAHPCERYAGPMLEGDDETILYLRENLDIEEDSWFFRELVLAQVQLATTFGDHEFASTVTRLLQILDQRELLRNPGLTLILDRYAQITGHPLHTDLRDRAVEWWRNPWLPSNAHTWGGVDPAAKEMVADWLKSEFILAFFERLSADRHSDRRRANFWMKYVKSMNHVQFALKNVQQYSYDKDFRALLKKMEGLVTPILDGPSNGTAFIMSIGDMTAVEFGSAGNAFYAYETSRLPFDLKKAVSLAKNIRNSLKHDNRQLWLMHKDDVHGYARWEDRFAAELRGRFDVHPGDPAARSGGTSSKAKMERAQSNSTPSPGSQGNTSTAHEDATPRSSGFPFEMGRLRTFAAARRFRLEDRTSNNGCLWALTDDRDAQVTKVLSGWGFRYKPGKGWWREKG